MRDIREALARGDWPAVLKDAGKEAAWRQPGVLKIFIRAACEVQDLNGLDRAASFAETASKDWPPQQRFAIVREIARSGAPVPAWRLLSSFPADAGDPAFIREASRIIPYVKDGTTRREIQDALSQKLRRSEATPLERSSAAFPAPGAIPRPPADITIAASSATPQRHVEGLRDAIVEHRKRTQKGSGPAVFERRDVFVSRIGQIWDERGVVYATASREPPNVTREDVPTIDEGFSVAGASRGIYHWLAERVANLSWMFEPGAPRVTVLQSGGAPEFERDTLALAGLSNSPLHVIDEAVFVRRLLIARTGFAGLRYWDRVAPVFEAMKASAREAATAEGVEPNRLLYISRSRAARRIMANEAELEAALRARGYAIVLFEDLPLWRQVFLTTHAEHVISPHGAGLSHILFRSPGTRVTELLPIRDGTYGLRFNYARLSSTLGLDYTAWLEPQVGADDSWRMDIPAFLAHLDARS
ncbi:hypothetical protein JOD31_003518 [Methylopila capsulata]|uniref:Glycosyltransferase 61 catalytic domain-containing protein n=1 Tax=Methylopila capsulata TaxID=61654 RepID=A0A9W6IWK5_9HYPH|nr:glycosyltransferase family 61 protein [Methylopila capsulata]MBM7853267.1 hypothetical protein [Methylopila capsulata]GLK57518.1 hypothetical protein GCM10008170_35380 [Methylopila capsulata]